MIDNQGGNVQTHEPVEIRVSRYLFEVSKKMGSKIENQTFKLYRDLPIKELIRRTLVSNHGKIFGEIPHAQLTNAGALVVVTHPDTGRSPQDKFIVSSRTKKIWFKNHHKGQGNNKMSEQDFAALYEDTFFYLQNQPKLYEQNLYLGTDPTTRQHVRLLTPSPWHAAFAERLYVIPTDKEELIRLHRSVPDFIILHAPDFKAEDFKYATRPGSKKAIALDFDTNRAVIVGTHYAGEIKKLGLTVAMGILPAKGILPMHCSAVMTKKAETAILFGLSGTGKTTLSASGFRLIGDDEHGWGEDGIFNLEGGCYPKTINLNPDLEAEIHTAINKEGAIMENVVVGTDGRPDFRDTSITENTRAAFTLQNRTDWDGMGDHPKNIIFLTADATGVLPPVAKLTPEQAQYYFISGYTSKVAGTEIGITQPQPTFSPCFAGPFIPLHPIEYANLLTQKIKERRQTKQGINIWMVNTGWTGEAYDTQGNFDPKKRMHLPFTRAIINAILAGDLDNEETHTSVFGLQIPKRCSSIESSALNPKTYWKGKEKLFKKHESELAEKFNKNFEQYQKREFYQMLPAIQ